MTPSWNCKEVEWYTFLVEYTLISWNHVPETLWPVEICRFHGKDTFLSTRTFYNSLNINIIYNVEKHCWIESISCLIVSKDMRWILVKHKVCMCECDLSRGWYCSDFVLRPLFYFYCCLWLLLFRGFFLKTLLTPDKYDNIISFPGAWQNNFRNFSLSREKKITRFFRFSLDKLFLCGMVFLCGINA